MFRSNLLNSNGNKYHVLVSANEKLNVNVGQLKIGINDREKRITLGASENRVHTSKCSWYNFRI